MHTALGLCCGDTLDTMHATLIFQCAVDIIATHGKVDFLVAADSTFRDARHTDGPAFRLTVFLIHVEEITGKEGSLVATGSRADLHLHVLSVFRVLGHEGNLDVLFQLRLEGLVLRELFVGHFLHVGIFFVGEHVLGLFDGVETVDVSLACLHDVVEILILLGEFYITLLIGYDGGVGDKRADFLIASL